MFNDVPVQLTGYLKRTAADFDRESFYYFAAAIVSLFYLGKNFTKPDSSFLDLRMTPRGAPWWGHSGRVILIGESLFLMRGNPGFSEFCRRMAGNRDLRSTYFEAYAARMFFERGYEIRARPEAGVRGEDFDFQAVRGEETVNVEVTALTPSEFSLQTVETLCIINASNCRIRTPL